MATIQEKHIWNCPICNSEVAEKDLAALGLTKEELSILFKHRQNETLGKCLQLVDILIQKIDPNNLGTEAEVKNMIMELQNAKLTSEAEFKDIMINLQNTADDIQKRIAGTGIGKLGEIITVKELKAAFTQDSFTDEKAKKAGTDVVATVIENNKEQGKIAISCKYDVTWNHEFIKQLLKNMSQERTEFGILVTKSFPTEALDERVHYLENYKIMMVKPEFLAIAYGGFRRALLEWKFGQDSIKQIEEKNKDKDHVIEIVTKWINKKSNPILKQVELISKLCKKSHDNVDKLLTYVKRYSEQSHDSEDEKLEQLNTVTNAVDELDKFLDSKIDTGSHLIDEEEENDHS